MRAICDGPIRQSGEAWWEIDQLLRFTEHDWSLTSHMGSPLSLSLHIARGRQATRRSKVIVVVTQQNLEAKKNSSPILYSSFSLSRYPSILYSSFSLSRYPSILYSSFSLSCYPSILYSPFSLSRYPSILYLSFSLSRYPSILYSSFSLYCYLFPLAM